MNTQKFYELRFKLAQRTLELMTKKVECFQDGYIKDLYFATYTLLEQNKDTNLDRWLTTILDTNIYILGDYLLSKNELLDIENDSEIQKLMIELTEIWCDIVNEIN